MDNKLNIDSFVEDTDCSEVDLSKLPREDGHYEMEHRDKHGKNTMEIPYWAWNGYTSVDVVDGLSRKVLIEKCLEEIQKDDFLKARIIKDDSHGIIVQITIGYDFYGMREMHTVYVERKGLFVNDSESNFDDGGCSGTFFVEVG